jgi:hypothetical protein
MRKYYFAWRLSPRLDDFPSLYQLILRRPHAIEAQQRDARFVDPKIPLGSD